MVLRVKRNKLPKSSEGMFRAQFRSDENSPVDCFPKRGLFEHEIYPLSFHQFHTQAKITERWQRGMFRAQFRTSQNIQWMFCASSERNISLCQSEIHSPITMKSANLPFFSSPIEPICAIFTHKLSSLQGRRKGRL